MKKVKLLLTMAVIVFSAMLCCSMSAFALTEGDWEFHLMNNEVMITGYIGTDSDVIIPETLAGCPVTQLEERLFVSDKKLKSLEIRASVKEIPENFAYYQNKLETVVLPEGVESIGNSAFSECKSLTEIYLPSTLKTIGLNSFAKCESLESVNLPVGIQSIGSYAFVNSGLTQIDLSMVEKEYGSGAFNGCKKLKSVKLSPMIEKVPLHMFMGCESLSDLEIPNGITNIESQVFDGCTSLEKVILPTSLVTLQDGAFARTGLKAVIIPYGTESLLGGNFAPFYGCKNLQALFIPDTVTNIKGYNITAECPDAIIYCSDESYAAQYCSDKKLSYLTDNSVNSGIHVIYNGKRISFHSYGQNPEILDGRTLVPLRSIFEAMGADVSWDGATSTAIAKRGNVEVKITIGANEIYKNGKAVAVDVPAMLLNSRTMVPARVIAEAFGADVQWNGNGRIVFITE